MEKVEGILLPAYVESISTRKDKTVKVILSTQELSPEQAGQLFTLLNKLIVAYISEKEPAQSEIDLVDKINPEFSGKSQSQRLRNVFYKLFEGNKEGYKDFDSYYKAKTELFIEHLKSKIQ